MNSSFSLSVRSKNAFAPSSSFSPELSNLLTMERSTNFAGFPARTRSDSLRLLR